MAKVNDQNARFFYLKMASQSMCGRDVMITQISYRAYERECLQDKKHNFNRTLPADIQAAKAENILKSSYFFEATEALALAKPLQERQIENDGQYILGSKKYSMQYSRFRISVMNKY
jgi:predicted nuclease of restriction endonuclease-like (RecB) superfamily